MFLSLCLVAGLAGPRTSPTPERIAALIRQLGHKEFAQREAATRELDAIGAPALNALKTAAASGDAEVRVRAESIVRAVAGRVRAAVTTKELAKLQGAWSLVRYERDGKEIGGENQSHVFVVKGDQWTTYHGGWLFNAGTVTGIEVNGKLKALDLAIAAGSDAGATVPSIYAVEGDLLKLLQGGRARATEFGTRPGDGRHYGTFRRASAEAGRPPQTRFESATFSTDLFVQESKEAVHRVVLTCRPADGEAGTLTLDPNMPQLDTFGDAVVGGKPAPAVTLDCTLKLVKAEKERQLYELRGPKVISRLSLVVYRNMTPAGDSRLLVQGRGGEVRYALDLSRPDQPRPERLFPPCHPGCFPGGTQVQVPRGTAAIERIRQGDRVTTVDAVGKSSEAKVVGVFTTQNRVLEVQTDGGSLVTTTTQPVALVAGGFRAAGELRAGDRVWRWVGGKRQASTVRAVPPTHQTVQVFNLVLGEPTGFVAGSFLVRSKPPAAGLQP
jgi:uncharacterized protein (TIGR03067 family)